jgi:hypothetical protein
LPARKANARKIEVLLHHEEKIAAGGTPSKQCQPCVPETRRRRASSVMKRAASVIASRL